MTNPTDEPPAELGLGDTWHDIYAWIDDSLEGGHCSGEFARFLVPHLLRRLRELEERVEELQDGDAWCNPVKHDWGPLTQGAHFCLRCGDYKP